MKTATNENPPAPDPPSGDATNTKSARNGCRRFFIALCAMFFGMCAILVLAYGGLQMYDHVYSPKDLTREVLLGMTNLRPVSPSLSLQEISAHHCGEKAEYFFIAAAYSLPWRYRDKNYSWYSLVETNIYSEWNCYLIATRGDRAIWYAQVPGHLARRGKDGITPIGDTLSLPSGQMSTIQVQYQILETTAPQVTRFNDLMR